MTTRNLAAAATLVTATTLLLTACGGSGGKGSGKANGAQTGTPTSTASSASTAGGVQRPAIDLPPDLHYSFAPEKTGDPVKDAVLFDNEQFIKATDLAIAHSDPQDKAYQFYSEGPAAAGTAKWVQEYVQYGQRTTGTLRVFNRQAQVNNNGTAELTYCTDESKAYNKELKTGKVDVTPASENSYVLYGIQLRKSAEGIWMADQMTSTRGASQCRP